MRKFIINFMPSDSGSTAIEYSVLVAAIAVAIIGVGTTVGANLKTPWSSLESATATGRSAVSITTVGPNPES
jgi:Flp pilus assembly pilin Flp